MLLQSHFPDQYTVSIKYKTWGKNFDCAKYNALSIQTTCSTLRN